MAVFNPELAARMKMPKELLDEASGLHLAMHLGEQSVEAALFDAATFQCRWHVFSEITDALDPAQYVYQRNWNEQVFRKCSLSFDCDRYALIPHTYFDANHCEEYIRLQHGSSASHVGNLELSEIDAVLCFELPAWQSYISTMIPNARLFPAAALLLRYARMHSPREGSAFYAWVTRQSLTLACMKDKLPSIISTNGITNEEDVLYHLSNTAMQLHVDLEKVPLEMLISAPGFGLNDLLEKYMLNLKTLPSSSLCSDGSFIAQLHATCA